MITVSLIDDDDDDHTLVRHTIGSDKQLRFLSAYPNAKEALMHLPREQPDVALLDIKLPGMGGIECLRRLLAIVPAIRTQFLILTGHEDDRLIFDAFKAGANGYLMKGRTSSKQLVAAIKDVVYGGVPMTPSVARKVVAAFKLPDASLPGLSKRELEVLECLARGLLYKEIADELAISMNTVRTHLESIYHKLHVHSRKDAMFYYTHPQQWIQSQDHPPV